MRDRLPAPQGFVRGYYCRKTTRQRPARGQRLFRTPTGIWTWQAFTPFKANTILYSWGALVARLLARQGSQYGINGMYLEYQNVDDIEVPVTPPDITRDEGRSYYDALSDSDDTDYLRVAVVATTVNSTDETTYPDGNQLSVFAQSSGSVGVNGKPFSDSANSVVFGAALVAMLDEDDPTQDLLLSRFYYDTDKQIPKLASSQIGAEWNVNCL